MTSQVERFTTEECEFIRDLVFDFYAGKSSDKIKDMKQTILHKIDKLCYLFPTYHTKYTMMNGEIRCEHCGVLWSELRLD